MRPLRTSFIIVFLLLFQQALSHAQQLPPIEALGPMVSVKARVTGSAGQPVAGAVTYLSVSGSPFDLRTSITDDAGNAEYLLPSLPGSGQLIFQLDPRSNGNARFEPSKPLYAIEKDSGSYMQGYRYQDTSIFYGAPDNSYVLDDYTRFATLEEVFREFIAEVKVTRQGNSFRLNVINRPFKVFFDNEPLVLLDGIPIFDVDKLMELDPLKLKKIDVIARKYYLGQLLNYGIVSLFSFDRDLAGYQLPTQALVAEIGGNK
jgi:hypothetical protein